MADLSPEEYEQQRAAMVAVVEALQSLPRESHVRVIAASAQFFDCVTDIGERFAAVERWIRDSTRKP